MAGYAGWILISIPTSLSIRLLRLWVGLLYNSLGQMWWNNLVNLTTVTMQVYISRTYQVFNMKIGTLDFKWVVKQWFIMTFHLRNHWTPENSFENMTSYNKLRRNLSIHVTLKLSEVKGQIYKEIARNSCQIADKLAGIIWSQR